MDPTRFEEFTKSLATKASRRQALKTFAATTLGGILAFTGIRDAFARKKCPPGSTNCNGKCVDTSTDPNNCGICDLVCRSGICCNSLCCAIGEVCCNNTCVNLNLDPNNCGTCGNSCSSGSCCNGSCCPDGTSCCNGTCVDLSNDPNNCGKCGRVCGQGQTCKNGKCVGGSVCSTGTCPQSFMCGGPLVACGMAGDCLCLRSVEGTICCGGNFNCGTTPTCTTSADCPSGFFCQAAGTGCCGGGLCVPPCGDPSASLTPGQRTNRG